MGNTYEVWSWVREKGEFKYKSVYAGESFDEAMDAMKNEKKKGVACVKLEWRGS